MLIDHQEQQSVWRKARNLELCFGTMILSYAKISVAGCKIQRVMYNFFGELVWTYGSVVQVSRRASGDMGSIPAECWNSLQPLDHFTWHWARQCTDTRALYIAALSIIFFLGFSQWQSRANRVINLNTTIRLPLFWRTWTRAWDSLTTLAHMCWPGTWAENARDYSDCRASELTDSQVSGLIFSWFLENTEKTKAS